MHAIEPTRSGHLILEGFQIYFETFGDPTTPAVLLLPTWHIVHHRRWKMQVAYLARSCFVITYDPPGNGGGERTENRAAFEYDRVVDQGIGLLDHLGVVQADVVGVSRGSIYGMWMAARYPDRVRRLVIIGNSVSPDLTFPVAPDPHFWERRESYAGWEKFNGIYWREHYRDFLNFFMGEVFNEPHSTKGIEDGVAWGLETTPEILARTVDYSAAPSSLTAREVIESVRCPVLIIHGSEDHRCALETSQKLAAARPDFELVTLEGCGHLPDARHPVKVNLEIANFFDLPMPKHRIWRRALSRQTPRVLYISSPIGLGHVQRDLAIARELRQLVPGLQIDWLAQPPVTRVLEQAGETIHPLSKLLASESAHWEQSSAQHDLHCFYAFREMDEILLANFMVFLEVARATPYDLWIGDEAWEVDYYLHENPELKTAPFVFLTDFLGWLPIDRTLGSREVALTADYNAEMLEQVARFPRVRDRALYIGEYDDLIPEPFGPGLPLIPDWAREHFRAVGYVTPFNAADYADTSALRGRLGYAPDQPLVFYAVGGTAVGEPLLRKAIDAWPLIHRERPDARCIVVAGPRIDPKSLPAHDGMEVRAYVHNLFEHLAAADLGIVQGGLSTTMELTINRRPFLYFPIKSHCEQVYNVAYRLERYRAGMRLDYATTSIEALASAALITLGTDTSGYRSQNPGAAGRAASVIAELL